MDLALIVAKWLKGMSSVATRPPSDKSQAHFLIASSISDEFWYLFSAIKAKSDRLLGLGDRLVEAG